MRIKTIKIEKKIYLSPPFQSGRELEFVTDAIDSNWIAPSGPHILAFEKDIREYTGARASVALSSGTAAIHLALLLCGIKSGDEVLCSTFTFAGSAFPIKYCDALPVFIDSETDSWNMDATYLEEAILDRRKKGKNPKACIVVHLYGNCANMEAILSLCRKYDVACIEDAAEALGSTYKGAHAGTMGDFGIYSFNGNKIITTSGGGMLVSENEKMVEKARCLSTQSRDNVSYYEHSSVGYNYRMSNICAAIGRAQMTNMEERVKLKKALFDQYKEAFVSVEGISFIPIPASCRSNHWITCIVLDPMVYSKQPSDCCLELDKVNIEVRQLWKPMNLQPVFNDCPFYGKGVAEDLFHRGLCLPSGPNLNTEDIEKITQCIKNFLEI